MRGFGTLKYRVFLSHSRHDRVWGRWLAGELASFRIDKRLIGQATSVGAVPKSLRPIFRSCEGCDYSPADAHLPALQASEFLIVLCSPAAAASRQINEHIRRFNAMHRAERVIPVIVDGEPGDPVRDCLPAELRCHLAADRRPTDALGRPVIDARPDAGGKRRAGPQALARLLGLDLDLVARSDRRARNRRRCLRAGALAAALALPLAVAGTLAWARYQLAGNEALLERTLARVPTLADQAAMIAQQRGLPRRLAVGLLAQAEDCLRELAERGREVPQLQHRKAALLIAFARNYAALGDEELSRARASEAQALLQLAAETPGDRQWRRQIGATYDLLGDLLRAQGRLQPAQASYRAAATIVERLAADSAEGGALGDLAVIYLKLGDADNARGAPEEALASYYSALAVGARLVAADPGDARWQHGLLRSHQKIGDVLRVQGELEAALASYQSAAAIADALIARESANAEWHHALASSELKIGDVLALQAKPEPALAGYRSGQAIAERFAAETGEIPWRKDLAISHERVGAVLEAQGDLVGALKEYRIGLTIAHPLAAAEPGDTAWQRELAIAHEHVGDMLRLLGDSAGALEAYRAKRAIIARLAAAEPGQPGWQYDLGISHVRIGLAQELRGDFAAALEEYEAGLTIGERFVAADPGNAGWRRDLAVSYGRLAATNHRLGEVRQALADLRQARAIMAGLVETAPDFALWREDLAGFDTRIAVLEGRAPLTVARGCEPACATDSADVGAVMLANDARQRSGPAAVVAPEFSAARRLGPQRPAPAGAAGGAAASKGGGA